MSAEGNATDFCKRCCDTNSPIPIKKNHSKIKKGHAGLQMGLIELLWRRGNVDPSLPKLPADSEARAIAKTHLASNMNLLKLN